MSWYSKFCFTILFLATFSVLDQCTYPRDMYIAILVLAKSKKNPGRITGFWMSDDHKGLWRRGFTSLVDLCRIKMSDVAVVHLLVKTAQVSFYLFFKARSQLSALHTGQVSTAWTEGQYRWKMVEKERVTCWESEGKGHISRSMQYSDPKPRSWSTIRDLHLIEHRLTYDTVCSAPRILKLPEV